MRIEDFPNAIALADAASLELVGALGRAIGLHDRALFAATGGSNAALIYPRMRELGLEWDKLDVILTDERVAPEGSGLSNWPAVTEGLSPGPRFLPCTEDLALDRPIDAMILGMGEDLHIASIFPAGAGMAEALVSTKAVVPTTPDPLPTNAPVSRLTLTMPVLAQARAIVIAFTGAKKRLALETAIKQGDKPPVLILAERAGDRISWLWAP
jgi:6-phosphogluconolactonase